LMIDIDHFKEYNDNYGHQAGDDCLIKLVETISCATEEYTSEADSILARYGGEEFVLMVCGLDGESSFALAEKIRRSVEEAKIERKYKKTANHITLSIGVYNGVPKADENSLESFIGNADKALYNAKNSGRNQTKVYG